jgi:hypothetical protein
MASWVFITLVACAAGLVDIPTAGDRLIMYLFPPAVFTGLMVWWVSRQLVKHAPARVALGAAILVTVVVVGLFGGLTWAWRQPQQTSISPAGVREARAAGSYLTEAARGRQVAFVMSARATHEEPAWQTIQASFPGRLSPALPGTTGGPRRS